MKLLKTLGMVTLLGAGLLSYNNSNAQAVETEEKELPAVLLTDYFRSMHVNWFDPTHHRYPEFGMEKTSNGLKYIVSKNAYADKGGDYLLIIDDADRIDKIHKVINQDTTNVDFIYNNQGKLVGGTYNVDGPTIAEKSVLVSSGPGINSTTGFYKAKIELEAISEIDYLAPISQQLLGMYFLENNFYSIDNIFNGVNSSATNFYDVSTSYTVSAEYDIDEMNAELSQTKDHSKEIKNLEIVINYDVKQNTVTEGKKPIIVDGVTIGHDVSQDTTVTHIPYRTEITFDDGVLHLKNYRMNKLQSQMRSTKILATGYADMAGGVFRVDVDGDGT